MLPPKKIENHQQMLLIVDKQYSYSAQTNNKAIPFNGLLLRRGEGGGTGVLYSLQERPKVKRHAHTPPLRRGE